MHHRIGLAALLLLSASCLPPRAHAQEAGTTPLEDVKTQVSATLGGILDHPAAGLDSLFTALFKDPEGIATLNKIWQDNVLPKSRFLRNLNLEFKTFKVDDADSVLGLGFSYSIAHDLAMHRLRPAAQAGLSLSFAAEGNVAFEQALNPQDFLDSKFSFHLFKSWGGTIAVAQDEIFTRLNDLETTLAMIEDPDSLLNAPALRNFNALMSQYIRDQFYLDVSLTGGLEANQNFSATQYTFGARLGLDLNLWQHGYLNLFDWPFAAVRYLSGYDGVLEPRGGQFPMALFTLERVHPTEDPLREILGDISDYTRLSMEVTFKTEVASASYFEVNFRYYKELGASEVIRQAGLDEQVYVTAALTAPNGVFVSYTTGKLPFDARNDQIYQLGFRYNF